MNEAVINKPQRNSNLEILKIIAMFLICISHVYTHAGFNGGPESMVPEINALGWLTVLIKNAGWMGDTIFITCSAFTLQGNKKLNWRKMLLYYLDVSIIFLLYLAVLSNFRDIPKDLVVRTLTTIEFKSYWYAHSYVVFLLFLPLLVWITEKLPKKLHLGLIISFLCISLASLVLYHIVDNYGGVIRAATFYFAYVIVAYGRKYGWYLFYKKGEDTKNRIFMYSFIALWFIEVAVMNIIATKVNFKLLDSKYLDACYYYNPVYLLIAIPMVLVALNKTPKYNKFINYISSLSLIFYVMHHNEYTSLMFDDVMSKTLAAQKTDLRALIYLGFGVCRFIYGIALSIAFKETIHKVLVWLTNIGKKNNQEVKQARS